MVTPVINSPVGTQKTNLERYVAECRILANKAAGFLVETTTSVLVSAAEGGAIAATTTALLSAPVGPIVAITAPVAFITGFAWTGYEANKQFKRSYSTCLNQRGHFVIN